MTEEARRGLVQTLLVTAGCGGGVGLLPGFVRFYPGEPRLGSAPLGYIPQPRWGWCVAEPSVLNCPRYISRRRMGILNF